MISDARATARVAALDPRLNSTTFAVAPVLPGLHPATTPAAVMSGSRTRKFSSEEREQLLANLDLEGQ